MHTMQSRRSFLGKLLVAPLAAVRGVPDTTALLLDEFYIAGYQYHQGATVISRLASGTSLALVSEPENPFDSRAVSISWRDVKLGYVPRAINGHIFRLLAQGVRLESTVETASPNEVSWRALRVRVSIVAMPSSWFR